jgi:hypothetical protein
MDRAYGLEEVVLLNLILFSDSLRAFGVMKSEN